MDNAPSVPPLQLERSPRPGQHLELVIASLGADGLGESTLEAVVGPQQAPRRYRVLVRGALAGEHVRARVVRRRGNVLTARAVEIRRASPRRITTRCRHFGGPAGADPGCGGCVLQAVRYDDQLTFKRELVQRLIGDVGLDDSLVAPVIGQRDPWYYRNKMELSFFQRREDGLVLGLHPAGQPRQVIGIDECHLLSPFASAFVPRLAAWAAELGLPAYHHQRNIGFLRTLTVREGKRTNERMIALTTTYDGSVTTTNGRMDARQIGEAFSEAAQRLAAELDGEITSIYWTQQRTARGEPTRFIEHHLHGKPVLHEELQIGADHRLRFEIHPRAFFQPNTRQAELLYREVVQAAGLGGNRGQRALDLYCGTGTIALCLSRACQQVIGVELQPDAVDNARRNAVFNGLGNVTFFASDVGKALAGELRQQLTAVDLVVVDPPRSGLLGAALSHIQAIGAPRLVYVSCNPRALARDLVELTGCGYTITTIQPVDMFPQTAHVECVVQLER